MKTRARKETAAQRRAALARLHRFMVEVGAESQQSTSYKWRLSTPVGPLEVTTHDDMIYGAVFTRFCTPPAGDFMAYPQDWPELNRYSGKWNFHSETLGGAVDWFIIAATLLRGGEQAQEGDQDAQR